MRTATRWSRANLPLNLPGSAWLDRESLLRLLAQQADLAQIALHARVDKFDARCGCDGIGNGGFAGLLELFGKHRFDRVQGLGKVVGDGLAQLRSRQNVAPRPDRSYRL